MGYVLAHVYGGVMKKSQKVFKAFLTGALVAGVFFAPEARGREKIEGPYLGKVTKVIDGDTLKVRLKVWLDQYVEQIIRIKGIDTPEIRAACEKEKDVARQAKARLEDLTDGRNVLIRNVEHDKYGGRILADVHIRSGKISNIMIKSDLAVPYKGGQRKSWCTHKAQSTQY